MVASTMARLSSANNRAFSIRPVFRWALTVRATRFHIGSAGSAPHDAIVVCSAVRSLLSMRPRRFASLNSSAHSSLVKLGGPSVRNWLPPLSTNGGTRRQPGMLGFPKVGGVRRVLARTGAERVAPVHIGSIRAAQQHDLAGDGVSHRDARLLGGAVADLGE